MAVERVIHCDGPDCPTHIRTATPPPYLPRGYLLVQEGRPEGRSERHFCSWECVLRYAAKLPPPEVIDVPPGS